jgi:hypothetical protein
MRFRSIQTLFTTKIFARATHLYTQRPKSLTCIYHLTISPCTMQLEALYYLF